MFDDHRELTGEELKHHFAIALRVMRPSPRLGNGKPFPGSDDADRIAEALIKQLLLSRTKVLLPPPRKSHSICALTTG